MRPRHIFALLLTGFILYVAVSGGNAALRVVAVIAGVLLVQNLSTDPANKPRRESWTQVEIECHTGKLLDHAGYSEVKPAIIAKFNSLDVNSDEARRYLFWSESWSFIFLATPRVRTYRSGLTRLVA
jgi:hypothetical protein